MSTLTAPALLALAALALAGCGSSSSSSAGPGASGPAGGASAATSTTAASGGVNPNVPESLPPGDIPDTIAYPAYAVPGAGYTVSTPEGWSRTTTRTTVTWTDKLNTVTITAAPAAAPITVASVKAHVVPRLASTVKGFRLQSVTAVTRTAGAAIRMAYLGYSKPDPVTGKFGLLAIERYDFTHKGRDVTLTLSAPNGSDNVDPWNKITNSLTFTG
ncbi:MAG: hypothetical protein QOH12_302 [Solirubrobacteraceae bacterium]|jgi:hypothetical protein|nr:hypothetical protein [Solirubrobacteraceae bacterium]